MLKNPTILNMLVTFLNKQEKYTNMSTENSVLFLINIKSKRCRTAKSSTEKCSARKDLQFHVYFVKKNIILS